MKRFCSGSKASGRVLDAKGLKYVQVSLGEVNEKKTNSQKETGIVSWWKHLISRLTRSGNIRTLDGSLTPETQHLDSILTSNTCDSDGDVSVSSVISHQHANKYLTARLKLNQQRSNTFESFVLVSNDSGSNSSHIGLNISSGDQPTENDTGASSRHRSRSPALPCVKTNQNPSFATRGMNNPEVEEVCIAQAEVMYTKATWRMYERITSYRTATAITNQRFSLPAVQPRTDVDTALPLIEGRDPCFRRPMPYQQHTHLEYYDTQPTDTEPSLQHSEEEAQYDNISGPGLSVDSHHVCFEMDQD